MSARGAKVYCGVCGAEEVESPPPADPHSNTGICGENRSPAFGVGVSEGRALRLGAGVFFPLPKNVAMDDCAI